MERETKLYESYSIYRSVLWKYMQKKEGFLQSTAFNARERRDFVKIGRRLLLASPFVDRQEFRSCYQQKNFFWNLCGPKAQSGKKYSWILRSLIIRKSKNRRTSLQLADLSSYFWSSYSLKKKQEEISVSPYFLWLIICFIIKIQICANVRREAQSEMMHHHFSGQKSSHEYLSLLYFFVCYTFRHLKRMKFCG